MTRPGPEDAILSVADRRRERVEAFVHELIVAIWNRDIRTITSEDARAQLRDTMVVLGSVFAAGVPEPLRLEFDGTHVAFDGSPLIGASLQAGRLVRLLRVRGVRALSFDSRIDADAVSRFLELLQDPALANAFRPQVIGGILAARGIRGVAVDITSSPESAGITPQAALHDADREALESYQRLAEALHESHVAACRGTEIELDAARGIVEATVSRMGARPSDLLALAVYDDIDRFTVGHSVRVALLALETARAAGATEDELLIVGTAGLLHDIGKSQVPQSVLFKHGPLDSDEWRAMAEHPQLGAEILLEQRDVHPSAIGAAFCHHMAPGGRGYPDPIARFDPSGISRLIRVCDVFEALTAVRPYKPDRTPLEAMAIMHRQRDGFDARWLRFFFRTIGIYPIGTRVRLDSGEKALVVRHGPSCEQPVVRIVATADDEPVSHAPELVIGAEVEGRRHQVSAVIRRRAGQEHEDPTYRAVAPIQHACLGPDCDHGTPT